MLLDSIIFELLDSITFTIHRTVGEGKRLTPHFHIHSIHRDLDISQAITAGSSPMCIASSQNSAGKIWFPRAAD